MNDMNTSRASSIAFSNPKTICSASCVATFMQTVENVFKRVSCQNIWKNKVVYNLKLQIVISSNHVTNVRCVRRSQNTQALVDIIGWHVLVDDVLNTESNWIISPLSLLGGPAWVKNNLLHKSLLVWGLHDMVRATHHLNDVVLQCEGVVDDRRHLWSRYGLECHELVST